jgi:hypothetical protein
VPSKSFGLGTNGIAFDMSLLFSPSFCGGSPQRSFLKNVCFDRVAVVELVVVVVIMDEEGQKAVVAAIPKVNDKSESFMVWNLVGM